jgi:hypothetical protein
VAVTPVSGVNLHEAYLDAIQELLRGQLGRSRKHQVVVLDGAHGKRELDGIEAVSLARAQAAELVAVAHVTRLSSTARVRLTVYETQKASTLFTDELPAASPDDIDTVLERLTTAFATGKPARESASLETVTDREAYAFRKRTATSVWGLSLSGMRAVNTEAPNGQGFLAGFGVFWLYDMRSFLADVTVQLFPSNDQTRFAVGLAAYHPFSRSDTTYYAGGGATYTLADDNGNGLSLRATGGALIGRLMDVQLRGELSYFVDTFRGRIRHLDRPDQYTAFAHGPLFTLGLGF